MWSYYGSKSKIVNYYPKPKYNRIIEPFAGTARYSLKYFDRDIILVDKYPVIIKIWKWLQQCSKNDIMKLPNLKEGETINRNDFDCIEQAWLMGFMVQQGVNAPRLTVSSFAVGNIQAQKKFIVSQLFKIKHWKFVIGSYECLDNQEATWYIDPPYQWGGEYYWTGNKKINYYELADWCKSRNGQSIVCENTKADWLNFHPIKKIQGTIHKTTEAIWSNLRHGYESRQLELFASPPPLE